MSLRRFILASSLALFVVYSQAQTIPAFPGAEGYGAYAVGGRNGDVYHVTNLNASGAGSFADAIATVPSAGRTIVFDVSGYIRFPSGSNGTRLTSSKVTIAGQTAPGDGIGFYNNFFRISGDDIVIRHLRFRMGKYGSGGDCVDLDSGSLNAILDHVSMQFSTDENMSSFGSAPENLTLQYSLNAWGLESHSCGGLWDQNHATSHHNLWAHNHTRNPKSRPNGLLEWINNVTFDWDIGFIMGDTTSVQTYKSNVINNYFIGPPGNTQSKALVKGTVATNGYPNFTIFLSGNLTDTNGDSILNGTDKGYSIVEGTPLTSGTATSGTFRYYQAASAIAGSTVGVITDDALTAYKKIVSNAGALRIDNDPARTLRDEVDTRLMAYLVALRTKHITRESDLVAADAAVGGFPVSNSGFGTLTTAVAPTDTDRDGMPDFWEAAVGWNSAVDDHKHVLTASEISASFFPPGTASGYTSLEEYLHFLAVPHGTVAKWVSAPSTSITINLAKFTSAFTNSPSFAVTGLTSGTFAQFLADGTTPSTTGPIIKFTPAQNTVGRVKFNFTVTDSAGSTWTQQFALLVTVAGAPRNLVWAGDGSANAWNTTTNNWLLGATPTLFSAGDSALIDERGSATPAMSLTGTLSPSAVTIDAAKNYTLTGSGALAGTMPLVKSGASTLTISNSGANTFSGGTTINAGIIFTNNVGAFGSGTVTLAGATLSLTSAANLTLTNAINVTVPSAITTTNNTTFSGAFSGSGDLSVSSTIFTPTASWAGFSGKLTMANSGTLRFNQGANPWGGASATFDSGTSGTIRNRSTITATTITLGALSGSASSFLRGSDQDGGVTDTYDIGGLNLDTTFAGAITNGTGGTTPHLTALTKTGAGTLTLTGASTYTGATSVSAGTLLVNGTLGNTALTVASGATLSGGGAIGSASGGLVTLQSGAHIAPGASAGAAGTLTAAGGFSATSATFHLDLSNSPAGANDQISVTNGSGLVAGTNTFAVNFSDGILGAGNYKLIQCGAAIPLTIGGGMVMNLTTSAPAGTRQTFLLDRTASGAVGGYIQLIVGGNAANLTWVGALNSAAWELNGTANFNNAGTGDVFKNLDSITFDDTSANRTVTLTGSLAPRLITVDTTLGYTLGGAGALGGTAALVKNGTGTLTLAPISLGLATTTTSLSTTATVASSAGLYVGMSVSGAGIAGGTTLSAIVNATTLTLSQAATATGTNTLTFTGWNTFTGGLTLNAGTILLANDAANACALGLGPVTLNGGVISMHDDATSYNNFFANLVVPLGATARLNADSRVDVFGSLTGGGTLNFYVPYVRTTLFADWSAFTGIINVLSDAGGGDFRIGSDYSPPGYPLAAIALTANVSFYHSGTLQAGAGTTIAIGEISGPTSSHLLGGATGGRALTYRIGGRNTDATFAGTIGEQNTGTATSYVKTGAGTWEISGSGAWAGGTTVEQGTLKITGAFSCGNATDVQTGATLRLAGGAFSTDALNIATGAQLIGSGTITGDLNNSGTVLATTGGTLTVTGDVVNNNILRIATSTSLVATGGFVNNGVLDLLTASGGLPPNLVNNGLVIDSSSLAMSSVSKVGSTLALTVPTYSSHTYQMQRADSLTAPVWTNVAAAQTGLTQSNGLPTARTFTDPAATGPQRFYRVTVTP